MKGTIIAVILLISMGLVLGFFYQQLHPSLGESRTVDGIQFTVYNYAINESFFGHYTHYYLYNEKCLVIFVEAKNVGETACYHPDSSSDIVLKYKGESIKPEQFRYAYKPKPSGMYTYDIYYNITRAGWLCYIVPKNMDINDAYILVDFPFPHFNRKWSLHNEFDSHTLDTDGDRVIDCAEIYYGTDPDKEDTDDDGLTDYMEVYYYRTIYRLSRITDPLNPDSDGDGLLDGDEFLEYNTEPDKWDTGGDGLSDGDEVNTFLTSPHRKDTDSDGLTDYEEIYTNGTDPNDSDSDGGAESKIYKNGCDNNLAFYRGSSTIAKLGD